MPDIIEAYKFCPLCANTMEIVYNHHRKCTSCGYRVYFSPVLNVSVVFQAEDGQYMLSWRKMGPVTECWQVNGGFVGPGEDPKEAAAKHILRELGLVVDPNQLAFVTSVAERYDDQGFTRAIVCQYYFSSQRIGLSFYPQPTSESSKVGFFSAETMPFDKIGYESDKRALRALIGGL